MGKWLIRLAVLPVVIILTILEWSGTYILHFAGILCRLIAGMISILAVASYLTGLASGEEMLNTLVAGVAFYLIPRIGGMIVSSVALTNAAIIDWTKS